MHKNCDFLPEEAKTGLDLLKQAHASPNDIEAYLSKVGCKNIGRWAVDDPIPKPRHACKDHVGEMLAEGNKTGVIEFDYDNRLVQLLTNRGLPLMVRIASLKQAVDSIHDISRILDHTQGIFRTCVLTLEVSHFTRRLKESGNGQIDWPGGSESDEDVLERLMFDLGEVQRDLGISSILAGNGTE
jgi:hypothetical protein